MSRGTPYVDDPVWQVEALIGDQWYCVVAYAIWAEDNANAAVLGVRDTGTEARKRYVVRKLWPGKSNDAPPCQPGTASQVRRRRYRALRKARDDARDETLLCRWFIDACYLQASSAAWFSRKAS